VLDASGQALGYIYIYYIYARETRDQGEAHCRERGEAF
jgi:hypothetical protein